MAIIQGIITWEHNNNEAIIIIIEGEEEEEEEEREDEEEDVFSLFLLIFLPRHPSKDRLEDNHHFFLPMPLLLPDPLEEDW